MEPDSKLPAYPSLPSKTPDPNSNQQIVNAMPIELNLNPGLIIADRPSMLCKSCHNYFEYHDRRKGIPCGILSVIIIMSLFLFFFLLLFLCYCEEYDICPKCGRFTGNGNSNKQGICLC